MTKSRNLESDDGRFARHQGLLPATFRSVEVLVVGGGSVGSLLAEAFVRAGIGTITIADPDKVEAANLTRTVYTASDIGRAKAECLAERLRSIDPSCTVVPIQSRLQDMNKNALRTVVQSADLIIGAADDPICQVLLNRISQHYEKPALFVGLYKRGHGGEVVLSAPGLSACLECYAGKVRFGGRNAEVAKINYDTGRLHGEIALAADIQHVTSAATKIGLSLLAALSGDADASAAQFVLPLLASRRTVAVFGMEPGFWIFPAMMDGAHAQYAFQSVWLTVHRKETCPACGNKVERGDPIELMSGTIGRKSRDKLRSELTKGEGGNAKT